MSRVVPASSLTIFFPAHNEAATIATAIREAVEAAQRLTAEYEILVIDDASTDATARIVRDLSQTYPRLRLFQHATNLGYGAALRSGFTQANSELIFYTDADLPVKLKQVGRLLRRLTPELDAVIGYRINRYDTLLRWTYSHVYNFLVRSLLGVRVHDVNFSCKLIRRRAIQRFTLTARTVFIDGELLAELRRCGCRLTEVPVRYYPRPNRFSHFNSPWYTLRTLRELLGYWWRTLHLTRR